MLFDAFICMLWRHYMRTRSLHNSSLVEGILASRGALAELLVAAVLLSLGVNLAASAIVSLFKTSSILLFFIALFLILFSLYLIASKLISKRSVERTFVGLLVLKKSSNSLVTVPRYHYSEALAKYLEGIFAENEAIKVLWNNEPISGIIYFDEAAKVARVKDIASKAIIEEATEYYLLNSLSSHLSGFFNKESFDDALLREFGREDVPSILFKNRFLDTFSRPMVDRPIFVGSDTSAESKFGTIWASFGKNGARFERFDLILPREAKVTRVSKRKIEIDTSKFSLNLEVKFPGYGESIPFGFNKFYLEEEDFLAISSYRMEVKISVEFKSLALFTRTGWDYHMWLDSFIDSLEQDFSIEAFIEKIDWDRAMTIARVMQRATAMSGSSRKAQE